MLSTRRVIVTAAFVLMASAWVTASAASRHGGHVVVRHRPHVFVYGGHGFYSWYPGYYYGPGPYGYYGYPPAPPNYAIVDTDISPEEATVYLDGQRMGVADDFDGFPEYLKVPPGRHVLEFRRSGYQSLRIDIDADRGFYYDIDRNLHEGRKGEAPQHENWGGGPPRRRHAMQSPPSRMKPDTDREDEQMRRDDEENPDEESDQPNPDDEYSPDDQPNPDDEYLPGDAPNPDEAPTPDDQPSPDEEPRLR